MGDVRLAVRALRATPVVTAVAVLSLALGIGANTAIFSIVDTLLLRALPVRNPGQLVVLGSAGIRQSFWSNPVWEQLRDRTTAALQGAAAFSPASFDVSGGGVAQPVDGLWASGRFFDVLGVPAILGRTLSPDDDRRGAPNGAAAVISYAFWQREFGGAADAIGKTITLDRVPFVIVGVTPPSFTGLTVGTSLDVVVPLGAEPLVRGRAESFLDRGTVWWLQIIGRLRDGVPLARAEALVRGVQPQVREATRPADLRPDDAKRYLEEPFGLEPAATGVSFLRSRYQQPLLILMAIVGLVLLIACANIANLMLARAGARRHELSVRTALGASRWQVARPLFVESLLLALGGAAGGLAFARWGSALLVGQLATYRSVVYLDLSPDWRVLGFTAAIAIATALLFGVAPALRASRADPSDSLKSGSRGVAGGRGLASPLVVVQVAASLVLVVAAGLFVQTFAGLEHSNLGFDRTGVLVVAVDTTRSGVPVTGRREQLERIADAIARVPGVARSAVSMVTPVSGMIWRDLFEFPDKPTLGREDRSVTMNIVTPGWFATYGTPIVAGRDFTDGDRAGAPDVAIVNEAFVRKYFDGRNAVGRIVRRPDFPNHPAKSIAIVGVVGDAIYQSVREAPPPTMYRPVAQHDGPQPPFASVSVRAARGSPMALARPVTAALATLDPSFSLRFWSLQRQIDDSLTQERLVAILSGFFGALALLLAGIGLYGVTSYAVTRRRGELGIRLALGARPGGVVRLVLTRVFLLVGAGVVIGAAASLWAARFVTPLVFGLTARDPLTFAGAAVVLLAVGALAGWLPARRAARLDPAAVLRDA
jgi:predicted permease